MDNIKMDQQIIEEPLQKVYQRWPVYMQNDFNQEIIDKLFLKYQHDQQLQQTNEYNKNLIVKYINQYFNYIFNNKFSDDFSFIELNSNAFKSIRTSKLFNEYVQIIQNESIFQLLKLRSGEGTITINGPYISQPKQILIKLKPHQRRMAAQCLAYERSSIVASGYCNFGIIADPVGTGKSLSVLSMIAQTPYPGKRQFQSGIHKISNKLLNNESIERLKRNFKVTDFDVTHLINSNLIVIPHNTFYQWKEYIEKQTNIPSFYIGCKRNIDKFLKLDFTNEQFQYQIVLCKSTFYKQFTYQIHHLLGLEPMRVLLQHDYAGYGNYEFKLIQRGIVWQRIFIDEMDTINIANVPITNAFHHWAICSSAENCIFSNGGNGGNRNLSISSQFFQIFQPFVRNMFSLPRGHHHVGFFHDLIKNNSFSRTNRISSQYFVFKNDPLLIQKAWNLDLPVVNINLCFTPPELKRLQEFGGLDYAPQAMEALAAGDRDQAFNILGIKTDTEDGLLKSFTYHLQHKLIHIEKMIEHWQTAQQMAQQNNIQLEQNNQIEQNEKQTQQKKIKLRIQECNEKLANYNQQKNLLVQKIQGIQERIEQTDQKDCPICMSQIDNPMITLCCQNVFCFECLTTSMNSRNTCPLCRNSLNISDCKAIVDEKSESEQESGQLPSKLEQLIQIIKSNPQGKFLIFSNYDDTFRQIETELDKQCLAHAQVHGNAGHIKALINAYKEGVINILMLNARNFAAGMNLQMTTHVIIFHKLTNEIERQVIGRAQRPGRKGALVIHKLFFDFEYEQIKIDAELELDEDDIIENTITED